MCQDRKQYETYQNLIVSVSLGERKQKKSNSHRREPIGDSLSTGGLIPMAVALNMGVMYRGVLKTSMDLTKAVPAFLK